MSASRVLLVGLTVLSGATLALALVVGSVDLGMAGVWAVLQGGGDALQRNVILALRLPRALSAFAVGGLLALAGALMQVLLRNPLADPYILGVSGGAAVAPLLAMLAGAAGATLTAAAFAGALITMLLVFARARRRGGGAAGRRRRAGGGGAAGGAARGGGGRAGGPGATGRGRRGG